MRKVTQYRVSGVVETKPTHLPEGLEVEEVDCPLMETLEIGPFHFADSSVETNGVYMREDTRQGMDNRHLTRDQTTQLRDFLNKILEESTKVRVLRDREGDVWFELSPGKFALGGSDGDTTALANAKRKVADETGYRNWTFDQINGHDYFGPARFIENTWE